ELWMNVETLRELLRRKPFEPFEVRMTNGEAHQIRHPENALLAGARLIVYYPDNDRIAILSLLHAAVIEMLRAASLHGAGLGRYRHKSGFVEVLLANGFSPLHRTVAADAVHRQRRHHPRCVDGMDLSHDDDYQEGQALVRAAVAAACRACGCLP